LDSLAILSFQAQIYAGIITFSGASGGGGLIRGTLGAAAMMLVLGRPYGAFLKFVRQLFGLPSLPSTGRIEAYVARHGTLTTRISGVVIVQAGHPSREIPPVEFDECVPHIINRYCFRRTW